MSSLRSEKVADVLRKEISLIINKETKDPRLQNINITAVKVSDDIGIATVFYTLIGESVNKNESSIDNKILKKFS
jgi:ribosome-binding factor A